MAPDNADCSTPIVSIDDTIAWQLTLARADILADAPAR
jgi:hypothetical protein